MANINGSHENWASESDKGVRVNKLASGRVNREHNDNGALRPSDSVEISEVRTGEHWTAGNGKLMRQSMVVPTDTRNLFEALANIGGYELISSFHESEPGSSSERETTDDAATKASFVAERSKRRKKGKRKDKPCARCDENCAVPHKSDLEEMVLDGSPLELDQTNTRDIVTLEKCGSEEGEMDGEVEINLMNTVAWFGYQDQEATRF